MQSLGALEDKQTRDKVLDHAADVFVAALFSTEGKEGMAAFVEKRKRQWAEDWK